MTHLPFQPPLQNAEDRGRESALDCAMNTFPVAAAEDWIASGRPPDGRLAGWLASYFGQSEARAVLEQLRPHQGAADMVAAIRMKLAMRLPPPGVVARRGRRARP